MKVKASYILRLVGFFDHFFKESVFEGEKIVISSNLYNMFIMNWLHRFPIKRVEDYVREMFVGLLVLLENQIIAAFLQESDVRAIRKRRFSEPLRIIMKPRNSSCFTTTSSETTIGRVDWASLSINLLELKYRMVEQPDRFVCYRDH